MSDFNTEDIVEAYLSIRSAREKLAATYEAEDNALKADLTTLEAMLLNVCNTVGANSINTQFGTVIRSLKERFICNDWDNFKQFVVENQAVDLLERRIHQGNFKDFLKDTQNDGLPPGVNVMREYGISVRKASK